MESSALSISRIDAINERYRTIGNLLIKTVLDVIMGTRPGIKVKLREIGRDKWFSEIGMIWREHGFITAKVWPGSLRCPAHNDRTFSHWVDPKGLYLPPSLRKYQNGRRGLRGLIKEERPWDLDQPLDKDAFVLTKAGKAVPRVTSRPPKPAHIPQLDWII